LTRKFDKWKAENFTHISSLVISVLHPIRRIRLETHIALIRLKELPVGFRVLSAEELRIDCLVQKNHLLGKVLNNQTNRPENVCCEAMFAIEAIVAESA
jgi:hypothetical protein